MSRAEWLFWAGLFAVLGVLLLFASPGAPHPGWVIILGASAFTACAVCFYRAMLLTKGGRP